MYTTGGREQVIFFGGGGLGLGLKIFWREKGNRKIRKREEGMPIFLDGMEDDVFVKPLHVHS